MASIEEIRHDLRGRTVDCTALHPPRSPHATQIITGLQVLASDGVIQLEAQETSPPEWECPPPRLSRNRSLQLVEVDGRNVVFDLDDSTELSEPALRWGHAYFKRMLAPGSLGLGARPLGLNHPVAVTGVAGAPDRWDDAPSLAALAPSRSPGEGVLFLTRLWDPDEAHSSTDRSWRLHINAFRLEVLSALEATVGDRFVGGIVNDEFARRCVPAERLAPPAVTTKAAYLARAADAAVVVTSSGLHQSVGWRFAESISLGRPTAGEPVTCALPVPLEPGHHYLAAADPDELARAVAGLLGAPRQLEAMRRAALAYSNEGVAPDALVARAIHQVVTGP